MTPFMPSQQIVLQDGKHSRFGTKLSTTNATAVFTATSRQASIVECIHLANVDASNACTVLVVWYDGSTTYTIQPTVSIAASGKLTLSQEAGTAPKIPLYEGDEIRVTAQNANDIEVTVVIRETPGNLR